MVFCWREGTRTHISYTNTWHEISDTQILFRVILGVCRVCLRGPLTNLYVWWVWLQVARLRKFVAMIWPCSFWPWSSDSPAVWRSTCWAQKISQTCYFQWMFRRQKLPEELWYLAGAWILSHCQRKRQLKQEGTWTQFRWSTPRLLPIQVPSEHRADLICFNDKRLMHRRCDEFQDLWRCLRQAENLLPPWAMFARAWFWSGIFRTLKYHWFSLIFHGHSMILIYGMILA